MTTTATTVTASMDAERKFSTVDPGVYLVVLPFFSGQRAFVVRRGETANASARGGAYKTQWTVRSAGQKFYGDTRKEAVDSLCRHLDAKATERAVEAAERDA